jgi:glycosyltransferase involved in cell wall biosynthesis
VTVVSELYLYPRLGLLGSKLHILTNGFDLEEMARVKPYDFGHFAIVYTGIFHPPKRVITPVMGALRRLKETEIGKSVDWRFHYYGSQGNHVHEEAERFGVTEQVVLHGRVSRAEALSAVRGSGVTVVITSVLDEGTPEERGIVPGKLFEPLGLGKPVLLVAPRDSFVQTIIETTGLARIFPGSHIDGMASFFADVIRGQAPKPKNPEAYAWMNIIKRLDIVLREVIGKKGYHDDV